MPKLTRQQAKKMKFKAVLKAARERAETRVQAPFNTNSIGTADTKGVNGISASGMIYYRKPGSRISLPHVGQIVHGNHP